MNKALKSFLCDRGIALTHHLNALLIFFFNLPDLDWTRPLTPPATNRHLKSATPKTGSSVSAPTAIINKSKAASNAVADPNRANKLATTEILAPSYANDLSPTNTDAADESTVQLLSLRLQNELRRAKSQHLACTEVLLPSDLLSRIAHKMIQMSEKEPCGIRGSVVYVEFEDEPNNTRYVRLPLENFPFAPEKQIRNGTKQYQELRPK